MAGFWTGLVHGTLVCGATLAALSLVFPHGDAKQDAAAPQGQASPPQPREQASSPAAQPQAPAPEAALTPAPSSAVMAAAPSRGPALDGAAAGPDVNDATAAAETERPALQPLPDPIGSDFRRGSDDPPRAPAASPAPPPGEAPRSLAAGPELAPAPAAIPAENPRVLVAPAAPAGIGLPAEPEPLDRPQMETPVTPAQPGRVADAAQDALPRPSRPEPVAATEAAPVPGGANAAEDEATRAEEPAPETALAAQDQEPTADAVSTASADPQRPEVPEAPSDLAALTQPDSAAATSPLDTEAPQQPSVASEDRSAAIDNLQRGGDAPAANHAAAIEARVSAATPSANRAPRPAPDLSIPQAFVAPGTPRMAPPLPQPAGATPPVPDLSDLKPGASR
ncbi:hypothetical protein [Paracoccus niistensis]|uniref:Meckel syndrome type 1 protein n=1 Tax=Paracoccus niistensis TaxID=632935 RepID=A0ABV6I1G9_9RHOB